MSAEKELEEPVLIEHDKELTVQEDIPVTSNYPKIFSATCHDDGRVEKCKEITKEQAINLRISGKDVVVCGPDKGENRRLSGYIEKIAMNHHNKTYVRHQPHGLQPYLPHHQPIDRPPQGHCFYECLPNRKAS